MPIVLRWHRFLLIYFAVMYHFSLFQKKVHDRSYGSHTKLVTSIFNPSRKEQLRASISGKCAVVG